MARGAGKQQPKPKQPAGKWEARAKADKAMAWAGVFEKLVDKCGLAGAFLVFVCIFVLVFATSEQKHEIINLFILGHGIQAFYPTLVSSGIFILLLFGQQFYFGRRVHKLQIELTRLGQWKSDHQEQQIADPLHHSQGVQQGE
jgi:hypothetical protein